MAGAMGPAELISFQAAIASLRRVALLLCIKGKVLYLLIFMALTGRAYYSISAD
jgi:hypothetical protein